MRKSHGSVERIDRAGSGDKRRAGKEAEIEMPEWARAFTFRLGSMKRARE